VIRDQCVLAQGHGIDLPAAPTIVDFEKSRRLVAAPSIAAIRAALEAAGVEFIDPNGGGPGVRLEANQA